MLQDIEFCKEIGCQGVVIGSLNEDSTVNIPQTKAMVQAAKPMQVTFHRAFDQTKDPKKAIEDIISTGCQRILTSGHAENVSAGLKQLKILQSMAQDRISLIAGGGLNPSNALQLYPLGIREFHLSGIDKKSLSYPHTQASKIEELIDNLYGLE